MRRWMGKSLASGTIELPVRTEVFDPPLASDAMRVWESVEAVYMNCETLDSNCGTACCEFDIRISQFRLPCAIKAPTAHA
jgi:hypothetical protein